jgi:hypothetical protein
MNDEDSQAREHDLRKKIAGQMRSIGQAPGKPLPGEELQKLKSAASRLERMLKDSSDGDRETLLTAAGRLDQLLDDIRKGNDVTPRLKRRRRGTQK